MASSVSLRENAVHLLKGDLCLREHVVYLLNGDGAHLDFDAAVKDLPVALRGKKPKAGAHTPWQLLEHLRITQADVLGSLRDPAHQSPEFPAGYWPVTEAPPNEKAWNRSAEEFRTGHKLLLEIVTSQSSNLLAPLPGAEGQTILRKLLMLADHNSYHLGQLVALRRLLGAWQE
jgi:hypothetical protein